MRFNSLLNLDAVPLYNPLFSQHESHPRGLVWPSLLAGRWNLRKLWWLWCDLDSPEESGQQRTCLPSWASLSGVRAAIKGLHPFHLKRARKSTIGHSFEVCDTNVCHVHNFNTHSNLATSSSLWLMDWTHNCLIQLQILSVDLDFFPKLEILLGMKNSRSMWKFPKKSHVHLLVCCS